MIPSIRRAHPWVGTAATLCAALAVLALPRSAPAQGYPPAAPPYQTPSAPPEAPPLTTGGLTPPASTTASHPGEAETLERLEDAEREDSGRGLEFVWVSAETGFEYLALSAFGDSDLLDGGRLAEDGFAFVAGVGAGVRLVFITLGARFRLAQHSQWDLWTLNGEVGLHLPLGSLEPSFTLGAGYASLGAFDAAGLPAAESLDVSGFNARLAAALDWYLNPLLSLGAQSSVELLALYRSAAPELAAASGLYGRDGEGLGLGLTVTAVLGLHF